MGKHYIFSDTHHTAEAVGRHLIKVGKRYGQISATSTGDWFAYAANDEAPKSLEHGWTDAYKTGDKAGMKKHEKSWAKKVVSPMTSRSGAAFQSVKPYLEGGRVNAIYGNSDFAVFNGIKKYDPRGVEATLGGPKSGVRHINTIRVKKEGDTTFVYVPHNPVIASTYQGMSYGAAKTRLQKEAGYRDRMRRVAQRVGQYNSPNVVVLMHEAPAPERWYRDPAKIKNRLPPQLKAHYDSVLETIVDNTNTPKKNIRIFHGHLHEGSKKNYQYKGIKTRLLNIGDVVSYDTVTGKYRTTNVKPNLNLLPKKHAGQTGYYDGQQQYGAKAAQQPA